jgi:hypothetical protein
MGMTKTFVDITANEYTADAILKNKDAITSFYDSVSDKFMEQLNSNIRAEENRLGGPLSDAGMNRAIMTTLADYAKENKLSEKAVDNLTKYMVDAMASEMETSHIQKFKDKEEQKQREIQARANFIPAKLEY